jgi:hypothetical protein
MKHGKIETAPEKEPGVIYNNFSRKLTNTA